MTPQTNMKTDLLALASQIPCGDSDRDHYLKLLRKIQPEHGIRAIVLKDNEPHVRDMRPEVMDVYHRFRSQLPSHAPFSFIPMTEFYLILAFSAALTYPEASLDASIRRFSEGAMVRYQKNPMFLISKRASGDEFITFLELSNGSNVNNFGETVMKGGPGHIVHDHYDAYSELTLPTLEPYYEALLKIFGLKGSVTSKILSESDLQITIDWEV